MVSKKQPAHLQPTPALMQVRLLGPVRHHGDDYTAGDLLELAVCEATSLIALGAAQPVDLALPEVPAP